MYGIIIDNGAVDIGEEGNSQIFLHSRIDENRSNFDTFFNPLFSSTNTSWIFSNKSDFWSIPWDYYTDEEEEALPEDPENVPGNLYYELYNNGFIKRVPEDGIKYHKNSNDLPYEIEDDFYVFSGEYPSDFMKKYAQFISSDWNELVAVDSKSTKKDIVMKYVDQELNAKNWKFTIQTEREFIEANLKWYFINFDGIFWAFYSHNEEDIERIANHLDLLGNISYKREPELDLSKLKLQYL